MSQKIELTCILGSFENSKPRRYVCLNQRKSLILLGFLTFTRKNTPFSSAFIMRKVGQNLVEFGKKYPINLNNFVLLLHWKIWQWNIIAFYFLVEVQKENHFSLLNFINSLPEKIKMIYHEYWLLEVKQKSLSLYQNIFL